MPSDYQGHWNASNAFESILELNGANHEEPWAYPEIMVGDELRTF